MDVVKLIWVSLVYESDLSALPGCRTGSHRQVVEFMLIITPDRVV